MNSYDSPGTLQQKAQKLLEGRDLLEVFKETGLPFYWLRTFAGGGITNPSVNRIQHLVESLTKTKLKV
jgi:hypothetical protein